MKREYTKPDVLFESFSLSTSIAGNCEVKTYLPSNQVCAVRMLGVGDVFTSGMGGCDIKVKDGKNQFNDVCYHVPNARYNVFNS